MLIYAFIATESTEVHRNEEYFLCISVFYVAKKQNMKL